MKLCLTPKNIFIVSYKTIFWCVALKNNFVFKPRKTFGTLISVTVQKSFQISDDYWKRTFDRVTEKNI